MMCLRPDGDHSLQQKVPHVRVICSTVYNVQVRYIQRFSSEILPMPGNLAFCQKSHHGCGAQDYCRQAPHLEAGALRAHVLAENVCRQQVNQSHVYQDARCHLQVVTKVSSMYKWCVDTLKGAPTMPLLT